MNDILSNLIQQAKKKPMGDSWTYALPGEFENRLAEALIKDCAEFVYRCELLTVEQSWNIRKLIKEHYGLPK